LQIRSLLLYLRKIKENLIKSEETLNLICDGSAQVLSMAIRAVPLPQRGCQGASDPRVRQLVPRHERHRPHLLASKRRRCAFQVLH